ncbi:MAG TPA: threonine synthase, partial [Glaciecola sp.]|nr:threonine synthase [Glaciecola sp.]
MHLVNLKDSTQQVSFKEAVKTGLGRHQGLFFVESIEPLADLDSVLALPLAERSKVVLGHLIGDEFSSEKLGELIDNAFTFPAPVVQISEHIHTLELFHGPTLAFKDFGGRFMAQCLTDISQGAPVTILTATSGDTGAAVAHAFHGIDNINVVILFPKGKISPLQEKLFTTLGGNIHTVAVDGDFDACQAIVKDAFEDEQMRNELHLNSANSINISR